MKKKKRLKDPFAEREARRYERPIPSRELILQMISDQSGPVNLDTMVGVFGLEDERDTEAFQRRIRAMERDGQLICNRRGAYLPVDSEDLIRGRVSGHPDGYGFLIPDEGGEDLFLSGWQMRSLLHGDRALVRVMGVDRRGRREAALVEVLERQNIQVVGRFFVESGIGLVVPDNKRLHQDILIPHEYIGNASPGQIVLVAMVEQPSRHTQPIGKIIEVLGDHMAPGMEIDIAVRAHGLPHEWPDEVEEKAAAFAPEIPKDSVRDRVDLRDVPLVTIDGEDARDFDDAVFCEPNEAGWRLLVAIADVSAYVQFDDVIDKEARNRGTSVYFPGRVIPMLPEVLSNGLCSLNPGVDRLCMVCDMQIGRNGSIKRSEFNQAVMRSAARLTYTQVATMIVDKKRSERNKHAKILPHLEHLYTLYRLLWKQRVKRGAIDFETPEARILFGKDRKIERIVVAGRNDAHKLIEECMIAANVCAARFLEKHKLSALYRIHEGPSADTLADLRSFLGELALTLGGGDDPSPTDYAKLIDSIGERPDAHLIQTVLLRSLAQAVYAPDNSGHFGLAHEAYAHFTSPIRRYPDLLVHRAIRHILNKETPSSFFYSHYDMVNLGDHCSMAERRADDATRDAIDWLKCEYMLDKVGEVFAGVISAVTSFGIFVELNEVFVTGLAHISSLVNDYYHFDPVGRRLHGKRSGQVYRLGDPVEVRVVRVDLDERKIDFELADTVNRGVSRRGYPKRKRAKKK